MQDAVEEKAARVLIEAGDDRLTRPTIGSPQFPREYRLEDQPPDKQGQACREQEGDSPPRLSGGHSHNIEFL